MLADDVIQLLTAYVDGELSPRRRQAVLRLLYQSSEARELLRQLQENAHKVKQLPRRKLDASFPAEVLHTIAERQVTPAKPVQRPLALRLRWVPYAMTGVAAAVLFAVALGGAIYLALGGFGPDGSLLNPGEGIAKKEPVGPEPMPSLIEPKAIEDPAPLPKPPSPQIAHVIEGIYQQYAIHIPPERSLSFSVAELRKDSLAKLAAELKKNEAVQLDVTVRSSPEAMKRLKDVLKKHKVDLVVDPGSHVALQKTPAKTELLVYAENLKADEWTQILKELAQEEKKAAANPFNKITVASLAPRERQQVTDLLGTDPTKRVDPKATQGIIQPKDKPKNPAPKAVDRVVVVLPQAPQASTSLEVSRFLNQPLQPQPGSMRVLIRLRQE